MEEAMPLLSAGSKYKDVKVSRVYRDTTACGRSSKSLVAYRNNSFRFTVEQGLADSVFSER